MGGKEVYAGCCHLGTPKDLGQEKCGGRNAEVVGTWGWQGLGGLANLTGVGEPGVGWNLEGGIPYSNALFHELAHPWGTRGVVG